MTVKKYKIRQCLVDAIQLLPTNLPEVVKFADVGVEKHQSMLAVELGGNASDVTEASDGTVSMVKDTLARGGSLFLLYVNYDKLTQRAEAGDWIIRGHGGLLFHCADADFYQRYEDPDGLVGMPMRVDIRNKSGIGGRRFQDPSELKPGDQFRFVFPSGMQRCDPHVVEDDGRVFVDVIDWIFERHSPETGGLHLTPHPRHAVDTASQLGEVEGMILNGAKVMRDVIVSVVPMPPLVTVTGEPKANVPWDQWGMRELHEPNQEVGHEQPVDNL